MTPPTPAVTYPQIAGHRALDLVDTVHWRLSDTRRLDTLETYRQALDWCVQMGLLDAEQAATLGRAADDDPEAARREHARITRLREAIFGAVFPRLPEAATRLADEYAAAVASARLEPTHDGAAAWTWVTPIDLSAPRARIALLAHDLVTGDLSDARQCGDDACGWVYLDRSPRHNRVWCTAAGCGNRNRVARHQARKRG